MEKVMKVCDICKDSIASGTCSICGIDICRSHSEHCQLSLFSPRAKYTYNQLQQECIETTVLRLSTHIITGDSSNTIIICRECRSAVEKALDYIKKGDRIPLLFDLLKLIKEHAKIEAI